jgi:type I restriction enzyme M protein
MILDAEVKGDLYEGLVENNAADLKSGAGQYFTLRPLIKAIVEVMRPRSGDTITDPACGTGGFVIAAHERSRIWTSTPTRRSTFGRCSQR